MKIFADYDDRTTQISLQDGKIVGKKIFYQGFNSSQMQIEKDCIYLLDESYFQQFSFPIYLDSKKKVTIGDIQNLFEKYMQKISFSSRGGKLVAQYVDQIYVNSEPKDHLIGKSGSIFFMLNFIFFDKSKLLSMRRQFGHIFEDITILPRSFYSLKFIKKNLQRQQFSFLTIDNESTKLVVIQGGSYKNVYHLNQGINYLKTFLNEEGIGHLYVEAFGEEEFGVVSEKIFGQVFDFFSKQINEWAQEYVPSDQTIFLISELTGSKYMLQSLLKNLNFGFVMPFASSIQFPPLPGKWHGGEIDLICSVNNSKLSSVQSYLL